MSVYEAMVTLIGEVPPGLEPVAWFVAAVITLYLIISAMSIVGAIVNAIGGRR